LTKGESEASDSDSSYSGKEAVMPINGLDSTKNVAAEDFSEEEAILIWLIGAIIGMPIVYAFGEWSGSILFENDEK
jgi:hypothetical protein